MATRTHIAPADMVSAILQNSVDRAVLEDLVTSPDDLDGRSSYLVLLDRGNDEAFVIEGDLVRIEQVLRECLSTVYAERTRLMDQMVARSRPQGGG